MIYWNRKYIGLALIVLFGLMSQLGALDPETAVDNYAQKNWQMKDGLPHNMANEILQASDGYLWIATYNVPFWCQATKNIKFKKKRLELREEKEK